MQLRETFTEAIVNFRVSWFQLWKARCASVAGDYAAARALAEGIREETLRQFTRFNHEPIEAEPKRRTT